MGDRYHIRPIKRFVLLLDDQDETKDGEVIVRDTIGCRHMDFTVVAVGTRESADVTVGDRVVLDHQDRGRRVRLDGVVYRLVRTSDIIAVLDD